MEKVHSRKTEAEWIKTWKLEDTLVYKASEKADLLKKLVPIGKGLTGSWKNQTKEGIEPRAVKNGHSLTGTGGRANDGLQNKEYGAFRKLLKFSSRMWRSFAGHISLAITPDLCWKLVTLATAFASSQKVDFFPLLSSVYQDSDSVPLRGGKMKLPQK